MAVVSVVGCDLNTKKPQAPLVVAPAPQPIVTSIEEAHAKALIQEYDYIRFDIEKSFGGRPATVSTVTASTDGGRIKLEHQGGHTVVWNRGEFKTTGDSTTVARDRFDIFTWQYFFMLPYKLSDKGVNVLDKGVVVMDDISYPTAWLTFDSGTGDAPDDWYKLHLDPASNRLRHVGYIVTAGGKSADEAADNAHSITYSNYQDKAGIPIASRWTFSNYDATGQQVQDSIGYALIRHVEFPEGEIMEW